MATRRNPIQKAIHEDRKWGEVHRDRSKYRREPPNHHEYDDEVIEVLRQRQEKEN
jgi:hypothetical protein